MFQALKSHQTYCKATDILHDVGAQDTTKCLVLMQQGIQHHSMKSAVPQNEDEPENNN